MTLLGNAQLRFILSSETPVSPQAVTLGTVDELLKGTVMHTD